MSDNITRILNLARVETKGYPGEFTSIDPAEAIERFLKKNRYLFADADIQMDRGHAKRFHCRINRGAVQYSLNESGYQCHQIRHMRARRLFKVHIESSRDRLHIHFKDNGIGFDKRERKKDI